MNVDVVTINFRTESSIMHLLTSLRDAQRPDLVFRITIVDCSGTMTSMPVPGVHSRIVDPGANIGFGQACNLAVEQLPADASVILFINPDCEVFPALNELVALGRRDGAVAWAGILLNSNRTVQRNAARPFTLRRLAYEYLTGKDTTLPPPDTTRQVAGLSGALLAVDIDAFRSIEGFDARLPLYVEDIDITARLRKRGAVVQYPIAVAIHHGAAASSLSPDRTALLLHASRIRYFQHHGAIRGIVARWIVCCGLLLRQLSRRPTLTHSSPSAVWRASNGQPLSIFLPSRPHPDQT